VKNAPKLRVTNPTAASKTLGVVDPASGRFPLDVEVGVGEVDGFTVALGFGVGDGLGVGLGVELGLVDPEGVDSKEGSPS